MAQVLASQAPPWETQVKSWLCPRLALAVMTQQVQGFSFSVSVYLSVSPSLPLRWNKNKSMKLNRTLLFLCFIFVSGFVSGCTYMHGYSSKQCWHEQPYLHILTYVCQYNRSSGVTTPRFMCLILINFCQNTLKETKSVYLLLFWELRGVLHSFINNACASESRQPLGSSVHPPGEAALQALA